MGRHGNCPTVSACSVVFKYGVNDFSTVETYCSTVSACSVVDEFSVFNMACCIFIIWIECSCTIILVSMVVDECIINGDYLITAIEGASVQVNNQAIRQQKLKSGDHIQVGRTTFTFEAKEIKKSAN